MKASKLVTILNRVLKHDDPEIWVVSKTRPKPASELASTMQGSKVKPDGVKVMTACLLLR